MNTHFVGSASSTKNPPLVFRSATQEDVDALYDLECECFSHDRLSKRSFRHWIKVRHGYLCLVELNQKIVGYGLLWFHKGTRLARIYSLAISAQARGRGLALQLLTALEHEASQRACFYLRLEVAKNNTAAINLYKRADYRIFGEYYDYYDDHEDAFRMQKIIRQLNDSVIQRTVSWYQQTTAFTCGPAALMMAMSSLNTEHQPSQTVELDIWREATTIFMTSGHGGCHPVGLALAAFNRGFISTVYVNHTDPLFIDGVRSDHKKEIMSLVHNNFVERAKNVGVAIEYTELEYADIFQLLDRGYAVIILISTYRLDGKKAPHWVTITHINDNCVYVHDPCPDPGLQLAIDCQYIPISREDFQKMYSFGGGKLRTAVAIARQTPG